MSFKKEYLWELLLARADIVEVIHSFFPLEPRGKRGVEHVRLCPFHKEQNPSFVVHTEKQFYHCFGCGHHGSVLDFLMKKQKLTFYQAVMYLAKRYTFYPKQWRAERKNSSK